MDLNDVLDDSDENLPHSPIHTNCTAEKLNLTTNTGLYLLSSTSVV